MKIFVVLPTVLVAAFSGSIAQALDCPFGSVKVLECEAKPMTVAYCETSLDGAAIVTSTGLTGRAESVAHVGVMKAKRALTKAGIVEIHHFPAPSSVGELVLAGQKFPARCLAYH